MTRGEKREQQGSLVKSEYKRLCLVAQKLQEKIFHLKTLREKLILAKIYGSAQMDSLLLEKEKYCQKI
jgi:hypothetical protein